MLFSISFLQSWAQQQDFPLVKEAEKNIKYNRFRLVLSVLYVIAHRKAAKDVRDVLKETRKNLLPVPSAMSDFLDFLTEFHQAVFRAPAHLFLTYESLLPQEAEPHFVTVLTEYMIFSQPTGKDDYLSLLSALKELARLGAINFTHDTD